MKIAYIMLVDWEWIKQRPHFIAEGLAQKHDVTVFYQFRYGLKRTRKSRHRDIRLKPIFVIPRGDRVPVLRRVNHFIKKCIIRHYIRKNKPDCVYLTYPDQVDFVPNSYCDCIIYDCMDNHSAFLSDTKERDVLERQECKLVSRAEKILVSSEKLKNIIVQRYEDSDVNRIYVIRNAFNGAIRSDSGSAIEKSNESGSSFKIAYFGTIGQWFDFDILLKSIEDFPNIQYILIGPVSGVVIPQSSNIIYRGIVAHEALYDSIADADCFIMPFVINDITDAVDPVKLYEYINFHKNILCVEYPEVERFSSFVYFYSDYASYKEQIRKLVAQNAIKYTEEERIRFLENNDWSSRVKMVNNLLMNHN